MVNLKPIPDLKKTVNLRRKKYETTHSCLGWACLILVVALVAYLIIAGFIGLRGAGVFMGLMGVSAILIMLAHASQAEPDDVIATVNEIANVKDDLASHEPSMAAFRALYVAQGNAILYSQLIELADSASEAVQKAASEEALKSMLAG